LAGAILEGDAIADHELAEVLTGIGNDVRGVERLPLLVQKARSAPHSVHDRQPERGLVHSMFSFSKRVLIFLGPRLARHENEVLVNCAARGVGASLPICRSCSS
jgi:hypothetical protein